VSGSVTSAVSMGTDSPTDSPVVEVVEAEHDGDTAIVAVTEQLFSASAMSPGITDGVLVVTADRGLRRRLPPDTMLVGPEWMNRLIDR